MPVADKLEARIGSIQDDGVQSSERESVNAGSTGAENEQKNQGLDLAHGDVANLIASGESDTGGNNPYGAFNYYKSSGGLGSSYYGLIDGKPIYEHSLGRLDELSQSGSTLNISYTDGDAPCTKIGRLFALGRYQIIPDTLRAAKAYLQLRDSDVFSPSIQDLCFSKYLILKKRPAVMDYLTGNGSIDKAALQIAQEWASIGIKPGQTNNYNKSGNSSGLTSYYSGDGVNSASVSYDQIIAALKADKAAIASGGIATQTVGETAPLNPTQNTESNGGADNSGGVSDPVSSLAALDSIDYDKALKFNKSYNYGKDVWREIQLGIGLTGADVDGLVGPTTTRKIAEWQAANGFTGSDLDGICGPNTLAAIRAGGVSIPAQPVETAQDVEEAVVNPAVADEPEVAVAEPESTSSAIDFDSIDYDHAVSLNKAYGYSKNTWMDIQRCIGLTGTDVDGIVGKVTSRKIAEWQAANGFSGSDVDGICGPNTLAKIQSAGGSVQSAAPAQNSEQAAQNEVQTSGSGSNNAALNNDGFKYFTISELIFSDTANDLGIDNSPTPQALENLKQLVNNALDPIREAWASPLHVNSGYRSPALNSAISGSSSTSQHMSGQAADLDAGNKDLNYQLLELIRRLGREGVIQYDQLINEYGCSWIHVSYSSAGNRFQDFAIGS